MVLTILVIIVALVIAGGLVALYREVGLGRASDLAFDEASDVESDWPFQSLAVGNVIAGVADNSFTGFVTICSDDVDARGALNSVAVVAEDWDYPVLVAVGRTGRANGWKDHLETLPGKISLKELTIHQVNMLKPAALPVVVFLMDGRVLDASLDVASPSAISSSFQRCRFGLPR